MPDTTSVIVHSTNAEALRAWDGPDGDYWADNEHIFEQSLGRYHHRFLAAASIGPDHRVLDVGCGTGQSTRDAARLARAGSALGIDLSSRMIDVARRRAAEQDVGNAHFLQADAQIHPFEPGGFDVVISRTGAMFFGDPVAAFANIGRALRPNGRLVLLVWQSLTRNPWVVQFTEALAAGRALPTPPADAPGPFSLADPDRVRPMLRAAGFAEPAFEPVTEPMYFGPDADEAFRFVRGLGFTDFMLRDLDAAAARRALQALRATIDAHVTHGGVYYPSAAWIITAQRP